MGQLSSREEIVAQHYNTAILAYESDRLTTGQQIEFAITARYLPRYIPAGAVVADVGVGVGHYAELLARQDCSLHLVDIAETLLDAATARLRGAGLERQVLSVRRASATQLAHLDTASCDAVLLLGPLYHLCDPAERAQALGEAARVLKPGGVLCAAAINRLAYLRDAYRQSPGQGAALRAFHGQFMRDGNLDPPHAPPIAYAHLSTSVEFRLLFADAFDQALYTGVESFTSVWGNTLSDLPSQDAAAWLDLVEQTGATPDGLGVSDHFLYIGHRRGSLG